MYFTGNKDIDILLLIKLEDLKSVCQVNKYFRSLCEDETFWMNRIIHNMRKTCLIIKNTIPEFSNYDCTKMITEINVIRDYFGFNTFRELYKYLNPLTKGLQLWIISEIFLHPENIQEDIDKIVSINKNVLPYYIDYDKLIYFIRREYVKNIKHKGNLAINNLPKDIPGLNVKNSKELHSFTDGGKYIEVNF